MKTKTLTLALVFIFCAQFLFSNNLNIELEEENYIDDIPFNTENIVSNIPCYSVVPLVLTLEDENYINDIPFSTKNVYDSLMLNSFPNNFQLDDETYINDIPFDTEKIYYERIALQNDKKFNTEEEYIDDIPFDTYLVSISSFEYYKIIFSNTSNEVQLKIGNYYDERMENLTRKIMEGVLNNFENKNINTDY